MKDHYEILQVREDASAEVIEAAFRRLARMQHPDVNADADAAVGMKELNAAFEVLGDPVQRAEYDRGRHGVRPAESYYETPATAHRPSSGRDWWRWMLVLPTAFAASLAVRAVVLLVALVLPDDTLIKLLWVLFPGSLGAAYVFVVVGSMPIHNHRRRACVALAAIAGISSLAAIGVELAAPETSTSPLRIADYVAGLIGTGIAVHSRTGTGFLPLRVIGLLGVTFLYLSLTDVLPAAIVWWLSDGLYALGWWPVGAGLRIVGVILAGKFALRCWLLVKGLWGLGGLGS